ncbi:hypothetical protein GWK47_009974 [Chionoecetes opilio]|uniref:Regulatory protein zeste n=1 Tax=Chionoecetes opilio TaxID=41210 RepID=A0A8J4XWL4_CHIOP|nr:hypothetical protein GWK47_009974 [Chionoecetes opilio]
MGHRVRMGCQQLSVCLTPKLRDRQDRETLAQLPFTIQDNMPPDIIMPTSQEEPSPKRRKSNWSADETIYLLQLINAKKMIIRGRYGKKVTSQDKKRAWVEVAEAVTSASSPGNGPRSTEDCERRWYNVLQKSKTHIARYKKEQKQTGGGPCTTSLTAIDELVYDIVGRNSTVVVGVKEPYAFESCLGQLRKPDAHAPVTARYVLQGFTFNLYT